MSMTMSVGLPGTSAPLRLSANGSFNFTAKEGELTTHMTGVPKLPGGALSMTELYKAGDVYIDSPLTAGKLPHGARWLKFDIGRFAQSVGLDAQSLTGGGSDPSQYLQYLEAAGGKMRAVGHEDVRGTPTTHYEGTIDLSKELDGPHSSNTNSAKLRSFLSKARAELGSTEIPISVWIDAHHLLRRMEMSFSLAAGAPAHGRRSAPRTVRLRRHPNGERARRRRSVRKRPRASRLWCRGGWLRPIGGSSPDGCCSRERARCGVARTDRREAHCAAEKPASRWRVPLGSMPPARC